MSDFTVLATKLDNVAANFQEFKSHHQNSIEEIKADIKAIEAKLDDKVVLCRDCHLKHELVDGKFKGSFNRIKDVEDHIKALRNLMYAMIFSIALAIASQFVKLNGSGL